MIPLTECNSSAVKAHGYDPVSQTLVIVTPAEKKYHYAPVPADTAADFAASESKGRAWGSMIRGKFDLVDGPQEAEQAKEAEHVGQ